MASESAVTIQRKSNREGIAATSRQTRLSVGADSTRSNSRVDELMLPLQRDPVVHSRRFISGLRRLARRAHALLEVLHRPIGSSINPKGVEQLDPPNWGETEVLQLWTDVHNTPVAFAYTLAVALRFTWRANGYALG